jgi:hypothetical protein
MRAKFSYLLPGILSLMLVAAYSASAQDDVPVPGPSTSNVFNQDPSSYDEKPLLMEQDARVVRTLSDSLITPRSITVPSAKPKADAKKPEGDPLNFNFLYYIIQKFKASDLMME